MTKRSVLCFRSALIKRRLGELGVLPNPSLESRSNPKSVNSYGDNDQEEPLDPVTK